MQGSRRRFFQQSGLLTAATLSFPGVVRSKAEAAADAPPHRIIHLVADGTSSGTWTLGDYFSRLKRGRGLRWFDLLQRPGAVWTWMNMRSLNSSVTDSAAASSAWGSGSRVMNGVLNQLPDGRELRPLYSVMAEAGWKRGLVTTTEITHATPAGFAAVTASRSNAEVIAAQYLAGRVEVLLGGGRKYFDPKTRKDQRDLAGDFARAGYAVVNDAADLAQAPLDKPLLGTFASGHLPYTLDQLGDAEFQAKVPTLAQMTARALRYLERSDRFILQVEGGRVDHAAHANDIAAAVQDLVAFDEALEVCLDFQRRAPETLLVVTTDHGTANPGLNGSGSEYGSSSQLFANTLRVRRSFERMEPDFKKLASAAELRAFLKTWTDFEPSAAKADLLLRIAEKKAGVLYDGMNAVELQLGQLMANFLGVGFTGGAHTADFVPLVACGPGAERFRGFLQNTDVFRGYLTLAGIDFRNPDAPLLAEAGPRADQVEALPRWA
ncbi:MAG: alkaline phosphatase [Verrucomicrobia bacterium]|nr:alkaline phosphatase [Verrucomicrobiota bacterium]